jgi:uncharacterized damage-inducible protein DinB
MTGRDLGASHGSIRGTLVHILWGEWLWLRPWRGESPKRVFRAVPLCSTQALAKILDQAPRLARDGTVFAYLACNP